MDIITIHDFQVDAIIGIYGFEREKKQPLILDIEMSSDIAKAARTENIEDALNYKAVTDTLRDFISGSEFKLIETLAERIAEIIQQEFNVQWVKIALRKPHAIEDAIVGLVIERGQK